MKAVIIFCIISVHICAQETVNIIRYNWKNPATGLEWTVVVIDGQRYLHPYYPVNVAQRYYPPVYNYYLRDRELYDYTPEYLKEVKCERKVYRENYYRRLRVRKK